MSRIIYWDCESFCGMYPLIKESNHFENINYIYKELFELHKNILDIELHLSIVGFLLCSNQKEQIEFLKEIKYKNIKYLNDDYEERINNLSNQTNTIQNQYINEELKLFSKLKNVKIGNHTSTHPYINKNEPNFDQILLNEIVFTDEKIKSELDINSEFVVLPQNKINDNLALELKRYNYIFRPSNIKWEYDENLESNGKIFKFMQRFKRTINIIFPKIFFKDPTKLDQTIVGQSKCGIFLRLPNNMLEYKIYMKFYKNHLNKSNDKVLWLHPHNFLKNTKIKLSFYSQIIDLMSK